MSTKDPRKIDIERLIHLVEANLGNWKPSSIVIVDINFKIWGEKGEFPESALKFYRKFPFTEMHVGDTVHNESSFMMKVTDKTAVLIGMRDSHIARLSATNLRGRINALSEFVILEDYIEEKGSTEASGKKEKFKKMEDSLDKMDEMFKNADRLFQD
ncbi:MAG: hypothetical protein WED07_03360 [Candidatus Freyarchaeum deiterrae]